MREKAKGIGHMSGDAGALPDCKMKSLPFMCAALGRFELELVGLSVKALTRYTTGSLRFDVHSACWLYCMVLLGRTGSCSLVEGKKTTFACINRHLSTCISL